MGHHPACVLDEVIEQAVFGGPQIDALAVHDHVTALQVHFQPVVDLDDLGVGPARLLEAAQHGADTAGQLAG